jgi:FKBP-type peptidyl-prolyl cis-trans isomerase
MKRVFILSLIICVIAACGFTEANESTDVAKMFSKKLNLENQKQKASYSIGYNMGKNLRNISSEIDLFIVMQGLVDGEGGDEKAQLEMAEMQKVMMEFQAEMRKKYQEDKKKEGKNNKIEGEKFLKENAKKEGVKVTESGLQYEIIKEGTGPHPKSTDKVNVHYKGMFIDGKEFDSSYSRGKPATFLLNRVIKGWTEGLQLMKVGAKWKFFIPAEIAYGEKGKNEIGPNAALIFEIELLGIDKPKEKPEPKKGKE